MSDEEKTIYRVVKNTNYTVINNYCLYDTRLSWKAKGLLAHMLSRPDDWDFHNSELVKHAKDGLDSVKKGIKELQEAGYIKREPIRDEKGRVKQWITIVYETPELAEKSGNNGKYPEAENPLLDQTRMVEAIYPEVDFPLVENPLVENPLVENPKLLNTDYLLSTNRDNNNNNKQRPNPFQYFSDEGFGDITDTTAAWIMEWLDGGYFEEPEGIVQAAMEQAVGNNKRSWNYVKKVLWHWYKSGIKTMEDVQEHQKKWEERKKRPDARKDRLQIEGMKKRGREVEVRKQTEEEKKESQKRFDELLKKIREQRTSHSHQV